MTYMQFVVNYINKQKTGDPIYTERIAAELADTFELDYTKAARAVSVAINRIIDKCTIPNLRFYQKGIYYLTNVTLFGETSINKAQLIADKYIIPDKGYETGLGFLNQIGLTTQIPNHRIIATNEAKDCQREDKGCGIKTTPPKTEINRENKRYLQLLDAFEDINKAPVDVDDPYGIIAKYINRNKLDYGKLLGLASKYYPRHTLLQLARTAEAGGAY